MCTELDGSDNMGMAVTKFTQSLPVTITASPTLRYHKMLLVVGYKF